MRIVLSIALVVIMIFTASAFVTGNGETKVNDIPAAVQQKVQELYPEASEVEWEKEGKVNYEAEFLVKGRSVEMLLDAEGNVIQLLREMDRAEVPTAINEELSKKNLVRVARVIYVKEGNIETYRVVGLTDDKRLKMVYDAGGKLLSETVLDRSKKHVKAPGIVMPSRGLSSFEKKWELPFILREVSGIALIDANRVACVQDELGTIFIYDLQSSKIVSEVPFGEAGDHEGIAIVNNDAWVLRSDGKLYEVKNFLSKPQVKEHVLQFTQPQNLEGLCYDKANDRLLIAPREFDTESRSQKGIYSFDLATNKFSATPVFRVELQHPVFNKVNPKPGKEVFMPSAMAIHPVTGKLYITDARNTQLLVSDMKGNIEKIIPLGNSVHPKTEGITFTPAGDIYLSNEGKKQSPNIVLLKQGAIE